MRLRRFVYETLHPEIYRGFRKRAPYFEGWYFKLVSGDEAHAFAVIPGVFRGQGGGDHAFVQILDGRTSSATYHEYPLSAFSADEERFMVQVGPNRFSKHSLTLDIDDQQRQIKGDLRFSLGRGWPVSLREPGVMGWYAWLPFMECYHGLVSFDHAIEGHLTIDGTRRAFDGGRGYIEKDWGQAFPSGYIWMQSNHFGASGTSLFASVALIPSLGRVWRGFLLGFLHQGVLYRMATYTGATVEDLRLTDDHVMLTVVDRRYRIEITAERRSGGLLKAPVRTEMHRRVDETMQSTLAVRLSNRDGQQLFEGVGRNGGLEVYGEIDRLLSTT